MCDPVLRFTTSTRLAHPLVYQPSKRPTGFIDSYGCGKGLSIATPCYEMPDISGFPVLVPRVNPRGPLGAHLGFNRGSFSGAFPIGGKAAQALVGGLRG
jgi:hypothetical protein